jgi:PAS domain S-box-containing protein
MQSGASPSLSLARAGFALSGGGVLRSSEEIFQALAAHTPVGIFVSNAEGKCVYVNERWCELAGLTAEQALGEGWAEALHPEDEERVRGEWAEASEEGRDSVVEYRFKSPDGSVAWIEGFASALHDEQGGIAGWVGTCLDLTARKEAEQALLAASERFRVAFENTPIGAALLAPDGRWFEVNPALCELLGYSEAELLRLTFADVTHPADLAASLERRRRQREGAGDSSRIEKRYLRSDGTAVWVSVSSTLVRDGSGEVVYTVAQIEDISERIAAQQAQREAEERFRRAFEDTSIGMALVGPDGRWLQVNRRLCEITGYSEAELLERRFQDITHPDDLEISTVQAGRLLAGGIGSYQLEKRYLRSDGSTLWVMLSVSLVRNDEGTPLYYVAQLEDISERKRAERELRWLADHDQLTGLLNRRGFRKQLESELLRGRSHGGQAALLLIDLDNFKHVNDTAGHPAGDRYMAAAGTLLSRALRPRRSARPDRR